MRALLNRRIAAVGVVVAGSVGAVGLLHLPAARPLLASLEMFCPVDRVAPEQVERMQARAVAALAGTRPAPAFATEGLRLMAASAAERHAWTQGRSFTCDTSVRGFTYVSCHNVPASAFGRDELDGAHVREVVIAVDHSGRTVGVDVLARTSAGRAAALLATEAARDLRANLGEPIETDGAFDADYLDEPYRAATIRYRFSDCIVVLSAMNIPGSGAVVREQYLAASALPVAD